MAKFTGHTITPDSALGGTQIQRSVRLNKTDSAYFQRTVSSGGNQKVWTWSAWFKRTSLHDIGGTSYLFSCNNVSGNNGIAGLYIQSDQLYTYFDTTGTNPYGSINSRKLRDITSWMHIVWQVDAANTSQKVWLNGVELSLDSSKNPPDYSYGMNQSGIKMFVGRDGDWGSSASNMYIAEVHYSDGNKYAASDFGYTDAQTGQWRPKNGNVIKSNITYGTNGFWLDFRDNTSTTTLGYDYSGNGNHFTATNISVSAGSGNDSVEDTCTNNFATINPLHGTSTLYDSKNGNLDFNLSNNEFAISTIYLPTSGKWYAECVFTTIESGDVGVFNPEMIHIPDGTLSFDGRWSGVRYGKANGTASIYTDNSAVQTGLTLISNNDIVGILADRDAGTISFTINGTAKGTPVPISTITDSSTLAFRASRTSSGGSNVIGSFNFGQRPFSHLPTGYRSLCSKNLATPSAAQIVRPQRHFDTLIWTGNNTVRSITGLEFKPDFVWVKCRSTTHDHQLTDSVRGTSKALAANTTGVEEDWDVLYSGNNKGMGDYFDGGFILDDDGNNARYNNTGQTYVAWCWKGGGAAVSNSDGTITSSISVNQEAGFSIVSYTGNGTAGATVGHGLGKKPAWILLIRRDSADNRYIYHQLMNQGSNPEQYYSELNFHAGTNDSNKIHNDTAPTTSVFSLSNDNASNGNTYPYIAYCWAEIPGYSKFGQYRANGIANNGPYVHLGFRPAWVMIKSMSLGNSDWIIFDNKRNTVNPTNTHLAANQNHADGTDSYEVVDFLANGFSVKGLDGSAINYNTSYPLLLYMAFAERPSGTMFGLDANAR